MDLSQDPREIAERDHARAILKKRHKCQCDLCVDKLLEKSKICCTSMEKDGSCRDHLGHRFGVKK